MFYHGNQTFIGLIKIIPVSFCFVNTSDGGRATEQRIEGLPNTPEMDRREPQT